MTTWTYEVRKADGYGYQFTVFANTQVVKTESGYGSESMARIAARDCIDIEIEGRKIQSVTTE